MNFGSEDRWLQPRSKIGVLHAIESIESNVEFHRASVNEEIVTINDITDTSLMNKPCANSPVSIDLGNLDLSEERRAKNTSRKPTRKAQECIFEWRQ